jgi:hypothetical protein
MNKKLWILTISAFFSLIALAGCSGDAVASIYSGNDSYVNTDFIEGE